MENSGIPQGEVFSHPWAFIKNEDGAVLLSLVTNQGLMPALVFTKPESLVDFAISARKAVKEFIPYPVIQAIELLARKELFKDEGDKDDGGAKVTAPTE